MPFLELKAKGSQELWPLSKLLLLSTMALRVGHNIATLSESFRQERIRGKLFSTRVAGVTKALAEKFENSGSLWYSRYEVASFLCSCRQQRNYGELWWLSPRALDTIAILPSISKSYESPRRETLPRIARALTERCQTVNSSPLAHAPLYTIIHIVHNGQDCCHIYSSPRAYGWSSRQSLPLPSVVPVRFRLR